MGMTEYLGHRCGDELAKATDSIVYVGEEAVSHRLVKIDGEFVEVLYRREERSLRVEVRMQYGDYPVAIGGDGVEEVLRRYEEVIGEKPPEQLVKTLRQIAGEVG